MSDYKQPSYVFPVFCSWLHYIHLHPEDMSLQVVNHIFSSIEINLFASIDSIIYLYAVILFHLRDSFPQFLRVSISF